MLPEIEPRFDWAQAKSAKRSRTKKRVIDRHKHRRTGAERIAQPPPPDYRSQGRHLLLFELSLCPQRQTKDVQTAGANQARLKTLHPPANLGRRRCQKSKTDVHSADLQKKHPNTMGLYLAYRRCGCQEEKFRIRFRQTFVWGLASWSAGCASPCSLLPFLPSSTRPDRFGLL